MRIHSFDLWRAYSPQMGELETYGIDRATLREMYELWQGGVNKSELERRYLNKPQSHGKLFTALVREHLGIETEQKSALKGERDALADEVARLKTMLRENGIDPMTGQKQ